MQINKEIDQIASYTKWDWERARVEWLCRGVWFMWKGGSTFDERSNSCDDGH